MQVGERVRVQMRMQVGKRVRMQMKMQVGERVRVQVQVQVQVNNVPAPCPGVKSESACFGTFSASP